MYFPCPSSSPQRCRDVGALVTGRFFSVICIDERRLAAVFVEEFEPVPVLDTAEVELCDVPGQVLEQALG